MPSPHPVVPAPTRAALHSRRPLAAHMVPTSRYMDLLSELRRQGATSRPPSAAARDAATEDAAGARQLRCSECGRRGLDWQALWTGRTYTPICACPACGDAALA